MSVGMGRTGAASPLSEECVWGGVSAVPASLSRLPLPVRALGGESLLLSHIPVSSRPVAPVVEGLPPLRASPPLPTALH